MLIGHQTPLYPSSTDPDASLTDTETVVDYFLKQGMPAEKICIGAAIYGRGWSGASAENNGLFQTFASVPKGTWDDGTSGSTGVFDYKDVVNKLRTGELKRFWDDEVKAAWAFNSDTGLMISYDDIASIKEKCKFVWNKNLGGVMVWELSGDDKDESLVDTIYAGLSSNDGGDDDSTTRTQSISSSATPSSSMTQPTSMTRTSSSVVETTATTTASSSSTGVVTSSTSLGTFM
jgi:GH18 family chitinase